MVINPAEKGARLSWIDSHCHLDFAAFDSDRNQLWGECRAQGIERLVIPGTEPAQWRRAETLAAGLPGVSFAAGLHPWWIRSWLAGAGELSEALADDLVRQLQLVLCEPKCVALGEAGLDLLLDLPLALQLRVLELQLSLAQTLAKPVIFHCVRAHGQLQALLKHIELPAGAVVHGFNGSYELARNYWRRGIYLGIGGSITYARAAQTRDAVKRLPLEAMLLETDAPDMPLQGCQGQRNSPLQLLAVARQLAELRGDKLEQIARQTSANALQLFGAI